ncbi:MAG: FAD-binding protein [Clostridia bacterium]|nr:FAD-binding protein [Clostridia bacterium]
MKESTITYNNKKIRIITAPAAVVGSGAAGFCAALRLHEYGVKDALLVTDGMKRGTSRNTGSDKQTYYKMNISGNAADCPAEMAKDFFSGGCVDGDNAYAEAANSLKCFLKLCELGVPFPTNRLGEYIGYQTDHDTRARATSAGPLTSKFMTEALEAAVLKENIDILDGSLVVSIIKAGEKVCGLLALDTRSLDKEFILIKTNNVVWATGGPAGMYADSVYPVSQCGMSGAAFEAGAEGKNLTEWQYGLASVNPRWNVSGTYMQVIPRFVSVDSEGKEYEFLAEHFGSDIKRALSLVFRKGYQWPFDCKKALTGSSLIDLLVYREKVLRGRKVYLDFRKNPFGIESFSASILDDEGRDYLVSAKADFGTPIERLRHMNDPAYQLYLEKGVDLEKEMLEISLSAQHNNGGIDVDLWWQTSVPGLFAAGEVAGTHGIVRPGGSALNAGQVGGTRAAQYIARRGDFTEPGDEEFLSAAEKHIEKFSELCEAITSKGESNIRSLRAEITDRMSMSGAAIRNAEKIKVTLSSAKETLVKFGEIASAEKNELADALRLRDTLACQVVYLSSMLDYIEKGGKSRGSSLYTSENGTAPEGLGDVFAFELDEDLIGDRVQTVKLDPDTLEVICGERNVRPLPEGGGFFENEWKRYREDGNVY